MNLYLWKESKWENTDEKTIGSHDRSKGRIYAEKGEGVSIVEGREERDTWVYWRTIEERVHQILKVTSNSISFFVEKKDRKKHMVQNYWYLNEWIVKNNYPLPLISDIVESIGTKLMMKL